MILCSMCNYIVWELNWYVDTLLVTHLSHWLKKQKLIR